MQLALCFDVENNHREKNGGCVDDRILSCTYLVDSVRPESGNLHRSLDNAPETGRFNRRFGAHDDENPVVTEVSFFYISISLFVRELSGK